MNIFSKKAFYIAFKGLCYAIFCFLRGLNVSWRKRNFRNNGPVLLFTVLFTKRRTLKFKAAFSIDFFAAVKQWALNHRNTQSGWKSTNHKPWPFEPVKVYFLRDRLRWLTAAKNANVSWLLNFRICMFLKSAAILYWGIETVSCHLLI